SAVCTDLRRAGVDQQAVLAVADQVHVAGVPEQVEVGRELDEPGLARGSAGTTGHGHAASTTRRSKWRWNQSIRRWGSWPAMTRNSGSVLRRPWVAATISARASWEAMQKGLRRPKPR